MDEKLGEGRTENQLQGPPVSAPPVEGQAGAAWQSHDLKAPNW